MKSYVWVLIAAGAVLLASGSAFGQCQGRARQAPSAAGASVAVTGGGASLGSGQILTGPGSLYYDLLMQEQMQLAMARQQQLIAMQKAARAQARLEKRLANAQKHRAEAASKREAEIARPSQSMARR